jgi:hypothetical protein
MVRRFGIPEEATVRSTQVEALTNVLAVLQLAPAGIGYAGQAWPPATPPGP